MTASAFVPGSVVPAANSSLLASTSASPSPLGDTGHEAAGPFSELVDQAIADGEAGKSTPSAPAPTSAPTTAPSSRTKPSAPGLDRSSTTKFGGRVLMGTPRPAHTEGTAETADAAAATAASARPLTTPKAAPPTPNAKADPNATTSSHPDSASDAPSDDAPAKTSTAAAPEALITVVASTSEVAGCVAVLPEVPPANLPPTSSSRGEGKDSMPLRPAQSGAVQRPQATAPGLVPAAVPAVPAAARTELTANPTEAAPPSTAVPLPDTAPASLTASSTQRPRGEPPTSTAHLEAVSAAETKSLPPGTPVTSRHGAVGVPSPSASPVPTVAIPVTGSALRGQAAPSEAVVLTSAPEQVMATDGESAAAVAITEDSRSFPASRPADAQPSSPPPVVPGLRPVHVSAFSGTREFRPTFSASTRPSLSPEEISFDEFAGMGEAADLQPELSADVVELREPAGTSARVPSQPRPSATASALGSETSRKVEAEDSAETLTTANEEIGEQVSTPRAIPGWDPARVAKGSPRLGGVTVRSATPSASTTLATSATTSAAAMTTPSVMSARSRVSTPSVVISRGDGLTTDWAGSTTADPRRVLPQREVVVSTVPGEVTLPALRAGQGRSGATNEGLEISSGNAVEPGKVEGSLFGLTSPPAAEASLSREASSTPTQPTRATSAEPSKSDDERAFPTEERATPASVSVTSGVPLPHVSTSFGPRPLTDERRSSAVPAVELVTDPLALLESLEAAVIEETFGNPKPTAAAPATTAASTKSASGSKIERPGTTTETTAKPVGRVPEASAEHKSPTREHLVDSPVPRATMTTAQTSAAAEAILSRMAAQMEEASVAGPSGPGRRRKEALEIVPTRDRMMAARLRSDVGTSSADLDDGMSEARFANKNAADSGHKLPGGRHSAEPGQEVIVARGGTPPRRFTPSAEDGLSGMLATAGSPRSVDLATPTMTAGSVASTHESAVERIHRLESLVTREVSLLRRSDAQNVSLVLRPDRDTELSVWLSQRDGRMEAEIRCERGDFAGLNGQWRQLQEVLADQHVRLLPLREAGQAVAESSSSSGLNLGQRDERSSSQSQSQSQSHTSTSSGNGDLSNPFGGGNRQRSGNAGELEQGHEGTRPTSTRGTVRVAPTRTEPARPVRRDHWEFWA